MPKNRTTHVAVTSSKGRRHTVGQYRNAHDQHTHEENVPIRSARPRRAAAKRADIGMSLALQSASEDSMSSSDVSDNDDNDGKITIGTTKFRKHSGTTLLTREDKIRNDSSKLTATTTEKTAAPHASKRRKRAINATQTASVSTQNDERISQSTRGATKFPSTASHRNTDTEPDDTGSAVSSDVDFRSDSEDWIPSDDNASICSGVSVRIPRSSKTHRARGRAEKSAISGHPTVHHTPSGPRRQLIETPSRSKHDGRRPRVQSPSPAPPPSTRNERTYIRQSPVTARVTGNVRVPRPADGLVVRPCPVPGCDGSGNINPLYASHHRKSGCPRAHLTKKRKGEAQGSGTAHATADADATPTHRANGAAEPVDGSARGGTRRRRPTAAPRGGINGDVSADDGWPVQLPCGLRDADGTADSTSAPQPTSADHALFEQAMRTAEEHYHAASVESADAREDTLADDTVSPHTCNSRVKQPPMIEIGNAQIVSWYSSPFPPAYLSLPCVYICAYTLAFFKSRGELQRHMVCLGEHPDATGKRGSPIPTGSMRRGGGKFGGPQASSTASAPRVAPAHVHPTPPGDEIYRYNNLSLWEVDGRRHRVYAQNLCLVTKLFLETKTLFYAVEPFLFYVLTEWDDNGAAIVGYFSKEKNSFLNYNLSCILTFPHHQRRGYGQLLIDFSYHLSRREGRIGTPEKPLSDLGLLAYRRYWMDVIFEYLLAHDKDDTVSIDRMSQCTGINQYDIISTLQSLHMIKYWRTHHVVVPRSDLLPAFRARHSRGQTVRVRAKHLRWTPYFATWD